MITANTIVVGPGGPPALSLALFISILKEAGSPALGEASGMYQAITAEGLDPAFMLAVFQHESDYATDPASIVVRYRTFNMGNTRSSRIGVKETITDPVRKTFVKYKDWATGARDAAYRIIDPKFDYAKAGARTIAEIITIWAPSADGNNTARYIEAVTSSMNAWARPGEEVAPKMKLKIALSAGHHNTDGGNQVEYSLTGPLCHGYAQAFRAAGADVRVITPQDGVGQSTVGLQAVAHQVVIWASQGWVADLYLETHTEGVGNSDVRGVFAIYPDWGTDLGLAVKNTLGARVARAISAASGIPVRGNGLMSEKSTGVGTLGDRLGIFLRTAEISRTTTRLIIEHGAHSSPLDLAILRTPGMIDRLTAAAVKTFLNYFGEDDMSQIPASAESVQMNGHTLGHGFLAYWREYDRPGLPHPAGLPITEEMDWVDPTGKKFVIQGFEGGIWGYDGTIEDPAYRVQRLLIGAEWLKNHVKAA